MGNTTSSKQIKTWIRKLIPYAALGLTLIATSRQIQILRTQAVFAQPVSYFRNSTQNKACHIAKDSILGYYEKGRGKTLIIILDGFPSESLYKILTGRNSQLHKYLREKSSAWREDYTPYPYTMYSLAYLLGGVSQPGKNCHYPFFGKNDKLPRQLIGNPYIQTTNQFCQEDEATRATPILASIPKKINNEKKRCTILLRMFTDKLLKFIAADKTERKPNSVDILHDTGYHDIMAKPIGSECLDKAKKENNIDLVNQLENADACYQLSINKIIDSQSNAKVYERIIAMSDHGPRISIPLLKTDTIFNTSLREEMPKTGISGKKGSLVDRIYYQFFSYGINITKETKGRRIRLPENILNQARFGIEGKTDKPRLLGRVDEN